MTWFDELDEQTQQQWRARIAKGRMELSASVEETLAESVEDEGVWEDEEVGADEEKGEVDKGSEKDVELETPPIVDVEEVSWGQAIIPPRLSLRTKPIAVVSIPPPAPAVPPATPVQPNTASPAVAGDATQLRNQPPNGQSTGVFSRLAQRLTSSLAAITTSFQPPVPTPQPPVRESGMPVPLVADASVQSEQASRVEQPETARPAIVKVLPDSYLPQWEIAPEQLPAGKQRPTGYPTKVHLQAAPKGTTARPSARSRARKETTPAPHERPESGQARRALPAARSAPPTVKIPVPHPEQVSDVMPSVPASPVPPSGSTATITTGGRLPLIPAADRKGGEPVHVLLPVAMFGSGTFEVGQGDAAVANQQIAGSSVVVVMLSSDPGPVVVQYISLRPGSGFTVHLSAPARTKATFNYVVFQG